MLKLLRKYESRNVTFLDRKAHWPIVWTKAKGVHVWDLEGRKYLDLTAAFGVAAAGHGNPRVVRAGQKQMGELLHAMGDVHPHALKAQLARELGRITFERWQAGVGKTIFCNSGFEAVEAALKTAYLETGKRGVIAFTGSYHGLGYGALTATHREYFRSPFREQLANFVHFAPFPCADNQLAKTEETINAIFRDQRVGAVLVEPVQGRGGIRIPSKDFLPMLRRVCDEHGALLIADEVFTGFGRTGRWFACEHTSTIPDVICLGKALTGGFPLSACVGRADVMDAWPEASGEALHTSTFLGHPVGCAMALAQIEEIRARKLIERSAKVGKWLLERLASVRGPSKLQIDARGIGLMAGLEIRHPDGTPATDVALKMVQKLLHKRVILLPEGEHANVISLTPPLIVSQRDLERGVELLESTFDN